MTTSFLFKHFSIEGGPCHPHYFEFMNENIPISTGVRTGIIDKDENLSDETVLRLLGKKNALKIAFIPTIAVEIALRYIERLHSVCRERRIHKKLMRHLLAAVNEYQYKFRKDLCTDTMQHFLRQVDDVFDCISWDSTTLQYSIRAELMKEFPQLDDEYEELTLMYTVRSMLDYYKAFINRTNELLESKTGRKGINCTDPLVLHMYRILVLMTCEYPITASGNVNLAMKIISNKFDEIEFDIVD